MLPEAPKEVWTALGRSQRCGTGPRSAENNLEEQLLGDKTYT